MVSRVRTFAPLLRFALSPYHSLSSDCGTRESYANRYASASSTRGVIHTFFVVGT